MRPVIPRWNSKTGELVRPDYFAKRPDGKDDVGFDFLRDYWVEAWQKFNARIREHQPEAIAFINPPVFEEPPRLDEVDQGGRCCLTPHYYDVRPRAPLRSERELPS